MVLPPGVLVVNGHSGFYIGADHIEFHRITFIGVKIKHIQFAGNLAIAEFCVINIAGFDQRMDAAIARIVTEPHIVPQYPPNLPGLIITPKGSTGRDADGTVKCNPLLHQHIHDPCGKQSPHGAAL